MVKRPKAETKADAHTRLQKRTEALTREHAALSKDRAPFNQADHDRHSDNLREHKEQLAAHKKRKGR